MRRNTIIYYLLALLTGVLISLMITANGKLTDSVGLYSSSVIIHLVGLTIMTIILILKKTNPFKNFQPWYFYLGGVLGVIATIGNNYAFEPLGVSAILALGLLGQSITGLIIDHFGLFEMRIYKLNPLRLISLLIMGIGAIFMIRQVHIVAMLLSFFVGSALVLQRVANGKLAEKSNIGISTLYTYITGLLCSIVTLILLGQGEPFLTTFTLTPNIFLYVGGAIGTITIFLSIICVPKLPSYGLSIVIFIGQIFAGVIIDMLIINEIPTINLIGGLIVTVGLITDVIIDKKTE